MNRRFVVLSSPLALLSLAWAAQPPTALIARHEKEALPLLKQYCLSCHAGSQPSGGISLDPADVSGIHKNAENWRKGLVRLKDRSMPPQGSARLS
ncbi:c-type cytochrome domain-containing protein, partial [Armatimonas sp.]|uniref:c-type cytochrome domain-containing protein n=1 Tax=Armatimonas sp. TaxID=1872638 RepID=UPI003750C4DB